MTLTPGRLLFEQIVPPHLREDDNGAPIDAGRIKAILQRVAEQEPDKYRQISHDLLKLGAKASIEVSASFGLDDLESPIDKASIVAKMRQQEALINANPKLSPAQKIHERVKMYGKLSNDTPEQVFGAAMKRGSNLAKMVASGARGSKGQLNSNIGADFLMLDANSDPIPVPITHSYAEGLSPGEYFASAYGTRRGLLSTKLCCSGDTKVLMGDFSEKEIRDIKVGEWVIGATKDGRSLRVQVKNVFSNGIKECWRHVFRRLSSRLETVEVCATADHQLLARKRDWGNDKDRAIEAPTKIAAGRMTKTRHVLVPAEGGNFGGIPEPRALLLGLLMGDECLTSQKHLLFSCADQVLLDDIHEYLAELNFEASRGRSETSYSYIFKYLVWPKRIGHECGCPTKAWLGKIGMMGKYAHEKEIPAEVWSWDNDSIANLLVGIYSTDGSIYTTKAATGGIGIGIALCLTSRQMLEQIKRLLEKRFGIYGGAVYHVPKEQKEHAKRDQWHFNINHRHAVELFAQHIPLVGKKRLTLESLRGQKAPSRCNEQYTFKFLHRELVGEIPTYDIEVDHPDHLFVLANGIISSNSISESGYLSKQLSAAAHDLVISKHNCDTHRGIPVRPDDNDSIGSVLARPAGGYQAGAIVTGKMLREIRDQKIPSMTVRSPLTCAASGGICAVCAGIREKNRFPRVMENVGLAAASSVGEPLSQGTLSEKHCLAEDTLVKMKDGSIKQIQDIKAGEWVVGCNTKGETTPALVLALYVNGVRDVISLTLDGGAELVCTPEHKVLFHQFGGEPDDLEIAMAGDENFFDAAVVEDDGYRLIPVLDLKPAGKAYTFDIEVDHPDHLFVLSNGMVVSNSGGVASSSGKAVSAFRQIDSLVQVPDIFPNAAAIAQIDGEVKGIEEAPQGGSYIHVGAERHYVPHGRDILVKRGDRLEAGDVLSAGVPNPAEIVKYKGIGEGRLYFVNALRKAMTDNKLPVDRRNLEILGRSLVNHVKVTDPEGYGGYLPDDVVEYDSIEHGLVPLKTKPLSAGPIKSLGRYLASPAMHYSIGTRITPSVAKTLDENGESSIDTMDESPGFEPEMQRVADIPGFKQDFMAQLAGSNLKRRLQKGVHSGDAMSDIHGVSYIPGLAKGTEFGKPPKGVVGY